MSLVIGAMAHLPPLLLVADPVCVLVNGGLVCSGDTATAICLDSRAGFGVFWACRDDVRGDGSGLHMCQPWRSGERARIPGVGPHLR